MKLHIGENIRKERVQKGLTQKQLARKLKLSSQHISNVEQQATLHLDLILKIAKALDVPFAILLGISPAEHRESEIKNELKQIKNELKALQEVIFRLFAEARISTKQS